MSEKVENQGTDIKHKDDIETLDIASTITPAPFVYSIAEKKLRRKIDRSFLPLIFLILFIQIIDKSIINSAAVLGLYDDTHITKDQFAFTGGAFYFGFLAFQIPNNFLMQRLPTSKYMGCILILWGLSVGLTSLAKTFGALVACRVLLGVFESSTYAVCFMLISRFYRRHEQVVYIGFMYFSNTFGTAFGGLIAFGIGHMQGLNGLSAWQYAYIIWGSVTAGLGILFFFFLPDRPKSRWFRLTPEEEQIVDERTLDNGMASNTTFNINHVYEAIKESRFYCCCALAFLTNLQNGSMTIFSSQIIQELGFTNLEALLLNIPNGVCGAVLIIMTSFLSKRLNELSYVGMGMTLVSLASVLILALVPSGAVKIIGVYLSSACTPMYIMMQTNVNSNVKGSSKKIFYTSGTLVSYSIGNILGPQFMTGNQGTRYIGGMLGFAGANVIALLVFIYLRWNTVRINRKRLAQWNAIVSVSGQLEKTKEVDDRTDAEDLSFVYRT